MNLLKSILPVLFSVMLLGACSKGDNDQKPLNTDTMMIRMAELQIEPAHLDTYIAILKEEAAASVRLEPGVICIYPMFQQENPTEVRLLEIYADQAAYEAHLQTPHFKHYKTATLEMVRSLELIDMTAIDPVGMPQLFAKLGD